MVYTGTHDNDTTMGWWDSTGEGDSTRTAADVKREKDHALEYLAATGDEMNWTLIRAALASVADTAIIPMQDILGLGSEARMNLPGRQSGNWGFRFSWDQLTRGHGEPAPGTDSCCMGGAGGEAERALVIPAGLPSVP